jgi:predicted protein tyrosine phosphatase
MWLALLVAIVVLGVWLGWRSQCPPLETKSLIRIRNGECVLTGEPLTRATLATVTDLLHQAGVQRGFIAIMPERRVIFSRQIPRHIHQQLRNVLLNY